MIGTTISHLTDVQPELTQSQLTLLHCLRSAHELLDEEAPLRDVDGLLSASIPMEKLKDFYETVLHVSLIALPTLPMQDGKTLFLDELVLRVIKQKAIVQFAFDCKLICHGVPDFPRNAHIAIQRIYEKAISQGTAEQIAKVLPWPGMRRESEQVEGTRPVRRLYTKRDK